MKVLTVTNMYPRPGREGWGAFVKTQVDSLRRRGVDTDIVVIDGFRDKREYLKAISTVRRLCRENRYDLVHAHYGLSGLVARAQVGTPVVVSYCGDDLYGHAGSNGRAKPTSLFFVQLHRLLSLVVDGAIVKSEGLNDRLPRRSGTIIPNGVDMDAFRPMDRLACRERLGLDAKTIYILFPYAPDRPRKNFSLVRTVAERMNETRTDGVPVEILTAHGLSHDLIPVYMNAADVLLLASYWEGSPNVVKEALACNMRVVSTDVGDVRGLLDGVDGCAVCDNTVPSALAAVEGVLARPGAPGGRAAVAHLSLDAVADRVIDVYRRVLTNRGRQDPQENLETTGV